MSELSEPVGSQTPEDAEAARLAAQKTRNVWLGLTLLGFVILVGLVSALRLAENIQRASGAG
jgi:hypothetical protein